MFVVGTVCCVRYLWTDRPSVLPAPTRASDPLSTRGLKRLEEWTRNERPVGEGRAMKTTPAFKYIHELKHLPFYVLPFALFFSSASETAAQRKACVLFFTFTRPPRNNQAFRWVLLGDACWAPGTDPQTADAEGHSRGITTVESKLGCEEISDLIQHPENKSDGVVASHQGQQLYLIDEISDQRWKMMDGDGKDDSRMGIFSRWFQQAPIIY